MRLCFLDQMLAGTLVYTLQGYLLLIEKLEAVISERLLGLSAESRTFIRIVFILLKLKLLDISC